MINTCFVISPIGEKDSDARVRADALYDLIIEPALEKFDFSVTRADKSTSISSITSEVVQLVQESDLCIIDISDHNPNVMYECGRRHETAKPYIMVAEEGQHLPFDINTIRTIFYNLNDAREIRNTVKLMQAVIERMLESGFQPERSGESLSSVSDTMARIERKIDRLTVPTSLSGTTSTGTGSSKYYDILSSLGLNGAFNYALSQRDIGLAEFLLPNLERQLPREKYVDFVLTQAAPMGSVLAHRQLEEGFHAIDTYERKLQMDYVGSLVAGYNMQDREKDGLELLGEFFEQISAAESPATDLSNNEKAFFLNQQQRLFYGLGKYADALQVMKEVLRLAPDEPAYHYNYSVLCERDGDMESAYSAAKRLYALMQKADTFDDDHLNQVAVLFAKNKDPKVREVFSKLQEINQYRADMLLQDKEVRSMLQG